MGHRYDSLQARARAEKIGKERALEAYQKMVNKNEVLVKGEGVKIYQVTLLYTDDSQDTHLLRANNRFHAYSQIMEYSNIFLVKSIEVISVGWVQG